ncbi:response regulator [Nodosilinea sp. P-1105]|uniref:response regulator n=1 Tax=Nodosilinea sp. P-1105 TaxID=2546229 RepID=UPI00146B7477|nr:response regulator [Nodosilinea sp. P-1105]NMF81828.1 response regulator [Nodosilinea sp. P-1105]
MIYDSQLLLNPSILAGAQILVVDNDDDSRCICKTLFETCGAQVTTLESIADAVTLLDYLVPDILICEIRFFNEDFLPLIQKAKNIILGQKEAIPILMVSAFCAASFSHDLLAMAEGHLLKPIDIGDLVDEVQNLVRPTQVLQTVNSQDRVVKPRAWKKSHAAATAHLAAC